AEGLGVQRHVGDERAVEVEDDAPGTEGHVAQTYTVQPRSARPPSQGGSGRSTFQRRSSFSRAGRAPSGDGSARSRFALRSRTRRRSRRPTASGIDARRFVLRSSTRSWTRSPIVSGSVVSPFASR